MGLSAAVVFSAVVVLLLLLQPFVAATITDEEEDEPCIGCDVSARGAATSSSDDDDYDDQSKGVNLESHQLNSSSSSAPPPPPLPPVVSAENQPPPSSSSHRPRGKMRTGWIIFIVICGVVCLILIVATLLWLLGAGKSVIMGAPVVATTVPVNSRIGSDANNRGGYANINTIEKGTPPSQSQTMLSSTVLRGVPRRVAHAE